MLYEVANYLTFPLTIILCVYIIVSGYYYRKNRNKGATSKPNVIGLCLGLFILLTTAFFFGVLATHWH